MFNLSTILDSHHCANSINHNNVRQPCNYNVINTFIVLKYLINNLLESEILKHCRHGPPNKTDILKNNSKELKKKKKLFFLGSLVSETTVALSEALSPNCLWQVKVKPFLVADFSDSIKRISGRRGKGERKTTKREWEKKERWRCKRKRETEKGAQGTIW